jgi:hypothetical protein
MAKNLSFKNCEVTDDELQEQFAIFHRMGRSFRHEINGHLANIAAALELIKMERDKDGLRMSLAIDELHKISAIIDGFVVAFDPEDSENALITKPSEVIASISPTIVVDSEADQSLELFFPKHIFQNLISELIHNATKHNDAKVEIYVTWRLDSQRFICEVHDSGVLIDQDNRSAPLPVHLLRNKKLQDDKSGLFVLDYMVSGSKGLLLFGRSERLGGNCIHIELPVRRFFTERPN